MSLSVWDLPVTVRPEFDDFEPEPCRSLLYTDNGSEPGPRTCRVSHAETGEVLHGSLVGTVWTSWTDAMAALSLVEFGPRPAASCSDCSSPAVTRGLCAACAGRELAADDRETSEEAA
jgi:hypothetical protein